MLLHCYHCPCPLQTIQPCDLRSYVDSSTERPPPPTFHDIAVDATVPDSLRSFASTAVDTFDARDDLNTTYGVISDPFARSLARLLPLNFEQERRLTRAIYLDEWLPWAEWLDSALPSDSDVHAFLCCPCSYRSLCLAFSSLEKSVCFPLLPMLRSLCLAFSSLERCAECVLEDEDGPFARKLELELATFGWETRLECSKHLLSTVVSDYFVYN
ncbi:hypothetical protein B0H13DRAFT_2321730 [Mycena leptocephala]|nr:hypothetical protein B0H13DRAFT_2321730 [Mycena leptocephala]